MNTYLEWIKSWANLRYNRWKDKLSTYFAKHAIKFIKHQNKCFKYLALDMNEYSYCSNKHEGKREEKDKKKIVKDQKWMNSHALNKNTHFKHSKHAFDDIEYRHNGVNNGSNVSIQSSIVILLSVLYVPMFSMYIIRWVQSVKSIAVQRTSKKGLCTQISVYNAWWTNVK